MPPKALSRFAERGAGWRTPSPTSASEYSLRTKTATHTHTPRTIRSRCTTMTKAAAVVAVVARTVRREARWTVCGEVGRVLRFPQLSHGPHPLSVHQCEWPMCRVATVYTCGVPPREAAARRRGKGERGKWHKLAPRRSLHPTPNLKRNRSTAHAHQLQGRNALWRACHARDIVNPVHARGVHVEAAGRRSQAVSRARIVGASC